MSLRSLERRFRGARKALQKRFSNAAQAFTPDEVIYRLGIREVAGYTVAYRTGTTDERQIEKKSFDTDEFFGAADYRPGRTDIIIDIGAHIGTFALLASSMVPDGHVHAIEPSLENWNYLRVNLALNEVSNVTASRVAIADRAGTLTLFHRQGHWGHSIMTPTGRGEEVEAMTLAAYFDSNGISQCSFMKLNCEGAEFPILLGAPRDVLRRCNLMLVLYHADLAAGSTPARLDEHLRSCGFSTSVHRQNDERGWIVARRDA